MTHQSTRSYGSCLLTGVGLLILTVVLHPIGGSPAYLRAVSHAIIATHTAAIIAFPLTVFGFSGLLQVLHEHRELARGGMTAYIVAAASGSLAAMLNGWVVPMLVQNFDDVESWTDDSLGILFDYNMSLNAAFDYLFMGAGMVAVLLWSIAILRTKACPTWLGYFGVVWAVIATILLSTGVIGIDLHTFRLFVLVSSLWTLGVGAALIRK